MADYNGSCSYDKGKSAGSSSVGNDVEKGGRVIIGNGSQGNNNSYWTFTTPNYRLRSVTFNFNWTVTSSGDWRGWAGAHTYIVSIQNSGGGHIHDGSIVLSGSAGNVYNESVTIAVGGLETNTTYYLHIYSTEGSSIKWVAAHDGNVNFNADYAYATISFSHQIINVAGNGWSQYTATSTTVAQGTTIYPVNYPVGITGFYQSTGETDAGFVVTGNATKYIRYRRNAVSITVDSSGGSGGGMGWSTPAWYGGNGTLTVPTRAGYTFAGWTKVNGTFTLSGNTVSNVTASGSVRANWTANTYTLNYNATGGTVTPASKSVTFGAAIGALPTPERRGYGFLGWFTAATGGTRINTTDIYRTVGNLTIYAQWKLLTRYDLVPIKISGNKVRLAKPYVWDGKNWREVNPRIGNGTKFVETALNPADFE